MLGMPSCATRELVKRPLSKSYVFLMLVICTLPHLGILLFFYSSTKSFFFFRSSCFSGGVFFRALAPGTLALDLPALILQRRLVFLLSHLSVMTTEFVSLQDEYSGRTLGVLLMLGT